MFRIIAIAAVLFAAWVVYLTIKGIKDTTRPRKPKDRSYHERLQAVANYPSAPPIPADRNATRVLDAVTLEAYAPMIHGVPGLGLNDSDFGEGRVQAGQTGELRLAKLIASSGLLSNYSSYWSLKASDQYDTDVDCVLYSKNVMWLIDAKNYVVRSEGDHGTAINDSCTFSNQGGILGLVHHNGSVIKTYECSKNMEMATEWYHKKFPNVDIRPIVLFCPTQYGVMGISKGTSWPGFVPVAQAETFVRDLAAAAGNTVTRPNSYDLIIQTKLKDLVKRDHSYSRF
jgi:hypothetical protein